MAVALAAVLIRLDWQTRRNLVDRTHMALRDADVLALAWSVGADIWTTDRDFAGTGIATWSTPNLMRGLAEAEKRRV